jgi:hypothetical protein
VFGTSWDDFDPASYGVSGAAPAHAAVDATPGLARSAIAAAEHPLSAGNAALWAFGLFAAAVGLIGFATSGRVGPLSASVKAGRT